MDLVTFLKNQGEGKTVEELAEAINKEYLPKNFVPSEKYNNVKSELKSHKEQFEKVSSEVAELSGKSVELESLKSSIEEYKKGEETRIAEREKELSVREKKMEIKDVLLKSKLDEHSVDDAWNHIDLEKVSKTKEGKWDGLDSQLESLKEKRPNWFVKTDVIDPSGEPKSGDAPKSQDWASMSLKDLKANNIV